MLDSLELTLCNMQGKLFEMSAQSGYDSYDFIKAFMQSEAAADLDKPFNHMQWAGEGYLLSRMEDEEKNALNRSGKVFDDETLYWSGYLYRYWHFYTGESSREIYKQAPAKTMQAMYLMYHTMSPEMAIDRLKETYGEKKKS